MTTTKKESPMNVGRLSAGIIVLAIGLLLVVLNYVLPEGKMHFMIGNTNMPLLPAILLTGVGIYLIFTARQVPEESDIPAGKSEVDQLKEEEAKAINKRLESIGWGLFFIMLGGFAFIPDEQIPDGIWSVGVGLIMLGLNAARYYYGIKMSSFTTVLGLLALLGGAAELMGFYSLDGALLLIILGAYLILKPWFDKRQLFG
jgi:drug/metabolite transporter (DMT)-like permease